MSRLMTVASVVVSTVVIDVSNVNTELLLRYLNKINHEMQHDQQTIKEVVVPQYDQLLVSM